MSRIYLSAPDVGVREEELCVAALRSGWVAPVGPMVDAFEAALADRCARRYAVALSSGTAALHLGLLELGAGAHNVVVVPTMTFSATANAVVYTGATPVFVDCDPCFGNLDPDLLDGALRSLRREGRQVTAVIAVDLLGHCSDYSQIENICQRAGVPLLSDAAEALGASRAGRPAGSFGIAAILSFNGNKVISTSGGGALLTDDERLAERVRYLSAQARQPVAHYEHTEVGYNYRLSNVLAALGLAQLERLEEMVARRRRLREGYSQLFADTEGVKIFQKECDAEDNCWLTAILVDPVAAEWKPAELSAVLTAADVESRPLWKPMHQQPLFAGARAFLRGDADRLFATGLSLPSGSALAPAHVDRVHTLIRSFLSARPNRVASNRERSEPRAAACPPGAQMTRYPSRRGRLSPLPFARPTITEDEIAEVVSALRSGWITTGPKTKLFEEQFGAEVGADAALALSSGTAAMHLALVAMGIGAGHRVFTSPMTFCSTVHVIEHVGARPVLVDIDPGTLNLDPVGLAATVREAAPELAAAVMPVHYGGYPCDMSAIADVARDANLCVIEDAAHAFGASYQGRRVGQAIDGVTGHAVCFSLYATKNITTGEGGVLAASTELVEVARQWSLHGMDRDAWRRYAHGGSWRYDVLHPGFKYNFTDLQAALGIAQLRRHKALKERRTAIARRYTEALQHLEELHTPSAPSDVDHAWHLYPLRLDLDRLTISRAQFIEELQARYINASVHFIPIHEHTYYREKYGWRAHDFPIAHKEFTRILSLPIYPLMTDEDVEDVVVAVEAIVIRHRRRT